MRLLSELAGYRIISSTKVVRERVDTLPILPPVCPVESRIQMTVNLDLLPYTEWERKGFGLRVLGGAIGPSTDSAPVWWSIENTLTVRIRGVTQEGAKLTMLRLGEKRIAAARVFKSAD